MSDLSSGAPPDRAPPHDELYLRLIDLRPMASAERALRCFLSPDEIERAGRFHFEPERSRFIRTRGGLRLILARCLATTPERIVFSYGEHGKPALGDPYRDSALSFNVSHSRDYALIGLATDRAIGVDVEQLRPMSDFESIAKQYFSPAEAHAIFALPNEDRLPAFFSCWTRKEAYMKATGEGMRIALDGFSVGLGEGETTRIPGTASPTGSPREWTVRGLSLVPGCAAAVATEGSEFRVSAWLGSGSS